MADRSSLEQGGDKKAREDEATSSETLADLENGETGVPSSTGGGASNESGSSQTSTPSPDGAFDAERGGRDSGGEAGEPM